MAIQKKEIIEIKRPEIVKTTIRIVGDSPLIMHRWTQKAKQQILDKQKLHIILAHIERYYDYQKKTV